MTSYEYATEFYEKILDETQEFEYYEPAFEIMEDEGTSHMSVVDQNGMACALTSTINTILGSKVRVKSKGFNPSKNFQRSHVNFDATITCHSG